MMRKKFIIGLFSLAVLGIVGSEYLFNRSSGAQDTPRKVEPDPKKTSTPFEIFQKDLESAAKELVPPPLSVPKADKDIAIPPVGEQIQPPLRAPKGDKDVPSPSPVIPAVAPPGLPTPKPLGETPPPNFGPGKVVPQPMLVAPTTVHPAKPTKALDKKSEPPAAAPVTQPTPIAPTPVSPQANPSTPVKVEKKQSDPLSILLDKPALAPASVPLPARGIEQQSFTQPIDKESPQPPPHSNAKKNAGVKRDVGADSPSQNQGLQSTKPSAPSKSITDQNAPGLPQSTSGFVQLKHTSPWSLHIDIINDQTIVTATVNKKHEFKIVCQHVELQTAQSMLKATGKVQIVGEALQGNCDHLSITLNEDRLLLEGDAEVRIQKTASRANSGSDSETKPATIELKGGTLTLRVSELQSSKFIETSTLQSVNYHAGASKTNPVSVVSDGTQQWSPYGKLNRTNMTHEGRPVWRLEQSDGQPILHFVTREGGSLAAYEGRTISVYGNALEASQTSMRTLLRVSHIALP